MRKKELLAAAVDRRSDTGLQNAWCQMVKRDYVYNKSCYMYRFGRLILADVIRVGKKEILQVSMWVHSGNGGMVDVPEYHIFIDRAEKKWITYDLEEEKWKTAMIDNLSWSWRGGREVYESEETTRLIQRYFRDTAQSGYITIRDFMRDQSKARRISQHQKELNEIDKVMKQVPKIPEGFREWAMDDAIKERRYIYYHAGRNVEYGYCTHCKKLVPVFLPKHNRESSCYECNSDIIYKADGKAGTVRDDGKCTLFQKLENGGYVIRYFRINREIYRERYMKPEETLTETKRIILDEWMRPGKHYVWDIFPTINKLRWCNGGHGYDNSFGNSGRMYPYNLTEQLKDSDLRYVPLEELMEKSDCIIRNATIFMKRAEDHYRVAEYLIKCRLYKLAAEFLESDRLELGGHLNVCAGSILQCLGITKEQLRILQKLNGGTSLMQIITAVNTHKVALTGEQIIQMYSEGISWRFVSYMRGTTPHKMLRYISSCTNRTEYLDYLDMRQKCEYDMTDSIILYPRDMKAAHDKMVQETNERAAEIRLKEVREKFPNIQEMFEPLNKKYSFEYKSYVIRPAKSAAEIVMEGRILHHCVGGDNYLRGHNSGRNIILMLRKKEEPDTPWYTVEYVVDTGKIRQYYAHHDTKPFEKAVSKWLDRWLKEVKKRELKEAEKANSGQLLVSAV